jgi:hypothetical protein
MEGNHFTINKSSEVKEFMLKAQRELAHKGRLCAEIWDIEGCYPNMPKETIRFALRKVLDKLRKKFGYEEVWVPKYSDAQPCRWRRWRGAQPIPFHVMLDVMEFSLDNAMVRMPDGQLLRQRWGIPMGDPLSPGMTLGACAWMEDEWMDTINARDKEFFRAKRFMDDILLIYAENPRWDAAAFIKDFQESECYQKPLKLEAGKDGTFLETRFKIRGNNFDLKLKNDNEDGEVKLWRYQHFHSNSPFMQKRATLAACLRKVHGMASDASMRYTSGLAKVAEFRRLRYPLYVLCKTCAYLGASTGDSTWIQIRDYLRHTA